MRGQSTRASRNRRCSVVNDVSSLTWCIFHHHRASRNRCINLVDGMRARVFLSPLVDTMLFQVGTETSGDALKLVQFVFVLRGAPPQDEQKSDEENGREHFPHQTPHPSRSRQSCHSCFFWRWNAQ